MIKYEFTPKVEGYFNLYPYVGDGLNFEQTKEGILQGFKSQFEEEIKKALLKIGLKYKNILYFSPNYYNYEGDGLTLVIYKKVNKELYKKAILKHKEYLNKVLEENKSYDGYISLTIHEISQEIEKLNKPFFEPDCGVLNGLLNKLISFKEFSPEEYFIFDDEN